MSSLQYRVMILESLINNMCLLSLLTIAPLTEQGHRELEEKKLK